MNTGQNKISFIPKKPLARSVSSRSRPISLLLTVAFVLFVISLSTYGGLYLYNDSLSKVLDGKSGQLEIEKEKVDPTGAFETAVRLENKTAGARGLLEKHIAVSQMFDLLEETTLKSIVLKDLDFSKAKDDESTGYIVDINGVATSYASLAAQSDVLNKEMLDLDRIENFSITKLILNNIGDIEFKMSMNLPESSLYYEGILSDEGRAGGLEDLTYEGFIGDLKDIADITNQAEYALE